MVGVKIWQRYSDLRNLVATGGIKVLEEKLTLNGKTFQLTNKHRIILFIILCTKYNTQS